MASGKVWLKVPETIKISYKGKLQPWVTGKDLVLHTIGKIGVDGARYMAIEFCGEVISKMPMHERFTMANMAIEAGAKTGLMNIDKIAKDYLKSVGVKPGKTDFAPDEDAKYKETFEFDISSLEPQVAFPHLPSNVRAVSRARGMRVDQVFIGSCTNGRLEDLREAAKIIKGKKVSKCTRCIVIPATQKIYNQALKEGLLEIFVDAGAAVSTPTCGPCLGGHMGILASGERAIASSNRNFVGRMGSSESEVFLANPAVCASSAVTGYIVHPSEVMDKSKK